jgi:hypothetical protein
MDLPSNDTNPFTPPPGNRLPSRNQAGTGNSYDEEKDGKGSKSEEAHPF